MRRCRNTESRFAHALGGVVSRQASNGGRDIYDYVVVGAGSAGCVLASRLSENPATRVLLLEAGRPNLNPLLRVPAAFPRLYRTAYDWNYSTEPEPELGHRRLYWPRGKTLGGSSAINAQLYTRGHPADFDYWASLGNPGWSYEDVLPWFQTAERFDGGASGSLGRRGPLRLSELRRPNPLTDAFVEACAELGIGRNDGCRGESHSGATYPLLTQNRGRRLSMADAYLRPADHRPNLQVVTGAHVQRVILEHGRATAVTYVANNQLRVAHAVSEILLAAGTIGSPQLLMLSGIGPPDRLRSMGIDVAVDLPGVGQHLQDHLGVAIVARCTQPISLAGAPRLGQVVQYVLFRSGKLASNLAEAMAFVVTTSSLTGPDVELLFIPGPFIDHGLGRSPGHALSVVVTLLQPKSLGSITLTSADPAAHPKIQPRYLSEADDVAALVAGVRMALRLLQTDALGQYAGETIEPPPSLSSEASAVEAFVRAQAESLYHPVGTCRMGTDPLAVVDPELRVHGVHGLRVVDASVMPMIIRGHPNAATVMIAERAAARRPEPPLKRCPAPVGPAVALADRARDAVRAALRKMER